MDEDFVNFVRVEIQALFERCIDTVEIAMGRTEQYTVVRARILRHGNNCLRKIDEFYDSKIN
jgi:hypothetical protein